MTMRNEIHQLNINETRELNDKDLDQVTGGTARKAGTDKLESYLNTTMTDVVVSSYRG
jgi:bacteriocin-like protein